jgi:hypothetical protein
VNIGAGFAYKHGESPTGLSERRKSMKSKKAPKKAAKLHKGKKLEEQKPLSEISLNFTTIEHTYSPQLKT